MVFTSHQFWPNCHDALNFYFCYFSQISFFEDRVSTSRFTLVIGAPIFLLLLKIYLATICQFNKQLVIIINLNYHHETHKKKNVQKQNFRKFKSLNFNIEIFFFVFIYSRRSLVQFRFNRREMFCGYVREDMLFTKKFVRLTNLAWNLSWYFLASLFTVWRLRSSWKDIFVMYHAAQGINLKMIDW